MANQQILDEEILKEFILDGREAISESEDLLLGIMGGECESGNSDAISAVFRSFHSLKGGAGFLLLKGLTTLAHEAETLLETFRMGETVCDDEHIQVLCQVCDLTLELLVHLEEGGKEEEFKGELEECTANLRALIKAGESPPGLLTSAAHEKPVGTAPKTSSAPADLNTIKESLRAIKADILIMTQFPDEADSINSALESL